MVWYGMLSGPHLTKHGCWSGRFGVFWHGWLWLSYKVFVVTRFRFIFINASEPILALFPRSYTNLWCVPYVSRLLCAFQGPCRGDGETSNLSHVEPIPQERMLGRGKNDFVPPLSLYNSNRHIYIRFSVVSCLWYQYILVRPVEEILCHLDVWIFCTVVLRTMFVQWCTENLLPWIVITPLYTWKPNQ